MRPLRNLLRLCGVFAAGLLLVSLCAGSALAVPVTAAIQAQYEKLHSFTAEFQQQLKNSATGEVQTRIGTIAFKQPSLIRWATESPEPELLLVGPDAVWDYFPDERTAMKYPREEILHSKTMLRFISGQANLEEDFIVEEQGQEAGLIKVRLTPKNPEPGLVLAYIWVDPESYLLRSILLLDFYGNANKLGLDNLVLNPELDDSLFAFTPPEGVDVQDNTAPGSQPAVIPGLQ